MNQINSKYELQFTAKHIRIFHKHISYCILTANSRIRSLNEMITVKLNCVFLLSIAEIKGKRERERKTVFT